METVKQSDILGNIISLRYLLGFLGEKSQCNWWPTSFYEATSIRFLEPVFARTAQLAQYQGVVEAARRFHDENLSVDSFHIFRLPEELEQVLHEKVQLEMLELFNPCWIADRASALNALSKLTDEQSDNTIGPIFIGKIDELRSTESLNRMGAMYHGAFSTNANVFPYWLA